MAGYRKLRSHISPNRFMKVPTHGTVSPRRRVVCAPRQCRSRHAIATHTTTITVKL